jgi:hypothetical protein
MTTEPHAVLPPVVGSRPLTTREIATIRAALRAWTVIDHTSVELTDTGLAEVGGGSVLSDGEIEQLLVDLGVAGDVTITPLHAADVRRI